MKYLVVIPARGGSKGVPGKNYKPLNGKPLIHYAIDAAREIFSDEDICVSTDSTKIKETAEEINLDVHFLRPDYLATDTAGTYEVLLHAIDFYEQKGKTYDAIVLLQPTSPRRTAKHIQEAINSYTNDIDMIVSVKETAANPYYVLTEENAEGFLEKSKTGTFTRRQDCPRVYEYNGAVYIININSLKQKAIGEFKKVRKYEMDELSSVDIDTPLDWQYCEFLFKLDSSKKEE